MADDRTRGHAAVGPAEEIHDDDELAAALAAELERIAPTGAVPVLRASAVPFGPAPSTRPDSPVTGVQPAAEEAPAAPVTAPARATVPAHATPPAPATAPTPATQPASMNEAPVPRPVSLAPRSARRSPPPGAAAGLQEHHRHAETAARHAGRRADRAPAANVTAPQSAVQETPAVSESRPERTPAFTTTAEARSGESAPGRRRAADAEAQITQPVRIPGRNRPTPDGPFVADELHDPLKETGPVALPPTLYEAWEQSLRSIGRPPTGDDGAPAQAEHGEPDAPTVTMSRAPEPPGTHTVEAEDVPVEAVPVPVEEPSGEQRRRRGGRRTRRAEAEADAPVRPEPATTPLAVPAATDAEGAPDPAPAPPRAAAPATSPLDVLAAELPPEPDEDADGVDEVDTGIRAVSAADTAAVPLPPMLEPAAPVTGAVPVAAGEPGSGDRRAPLGGPSLLSLLLLWCGALASPVLLLAGFGLAATGAGGAAAGALVLGVAVAVPAAVRITAVADADRIGSPALAARLFGTSGGTVVAAVLLAARLFVAVLALLAVADLAAAFAARTGVGGASTAAASVGAVTLAGLAALAAAVWPRRTTRAVLGVLAAVAVVVTVAVLVVTAPAVAVTVTVVPPPATSLVAVALGFAVPGLILTATAADAVRPASGRGRGRGVGAAIVLSAVVGLVVLVLSLAVGRGAGATGDAATAFAGVVADATPAAVAGPLALLLLLATLPLPALLIATAGDTAAVLIGAGRSARLGAVAAGLLVLAVALVLLSMGENASTALTSIGPVIGVPVAVWTGVTTLSPLRHASGHPARVALVAGSAVSTIVGWLLIDGLVAVGERSPLLELLRLPRESLWRASPALGLLVAFVLGLVVVGLARAATGRAAAPPASRRRSGRRQAVDSVEG